MHLRVEIWVSLGCHFLPTFLSVVSHLAEYLTGRENGQVVADGSRVFIEGLTNASWPKRKRKRGLYSVLRTVRHAHTCLIQAD